MNTYKRILAASIAIFAVWSVLTQFDLMLANRTTTVSETMLRFFGFFTILTNTLVAFYFAYLSYRSFKHNEFSV